jgi:hypothetical protein
MTIRPAEFCTTKGTNGCWSTNCANWWIEVGPDTTTHILVVLVALTLTHSRVPEQLSFVVLNTHLDDYHIPFFSFSNYNFSLAHFLVTSFIGLYDVM